MACGYQVPPWAEADTLPLLPKNGTIASGQLHGILSVHRRALAYVHSPNALCLACLTDTLGRHEIRLYTPAKRLLY